MANHTATKKNIRKTAARTATNKNIRNRVRTFLKKVEAAIAEGSKQTANDALKVAQSEIMRATSKDVFKLNSASRKISRLNTRIKTLK